MSAPASQPDKLNALQQAAIEAAMELDWLKTANLAQAELERVEGIVVRTYAACEVLGLYSTAVRMRHDTD